MESSNQQRGIQLFELGRYSEAIDYLLKDIQNPLSKFYLAYCYFNTDAMDKAENLANTLLSENPNNGDVFFLKSRISFERDDYKEARLLIEEAISIDSYNADYYGLKGAIFLQLKKYPEALSEINNALSIDAKNTFCLNLRAKVLTKLNKTEEATETVENILHDNPEDSFSHTNVGWVALENGETQEALHHFKQALQINPNFEYAREGMSTALKSKNFIYKWYLKYAFWLSNKSTKNQWVFIIGIYLAYRFGIKILSEAGLTYLVAPLIVAYLVFAMGGWIMESLSNAILNFDNYGKYLLSLNERRSGYMFTGLFGLGLLSLIIFYITSGDYYLLLGVTFFCALVPLPRAFIQYSKNARLFGIAYGSLMIVVGTIGFLFVPNLYTVGAAVLIMLIAFTWISNFID